ncbi:MAG: hypothetical protein AAB731_03590 [Patescibacteria group bacterium]
MGNPRIKFFDPHSGFEGAAILPAKEIVDLVKPLDGKKMTAKNAVGRINALKDALRNITPGDIEFDDPFSLKRGAIGCVLLWHPSRAAKNCQKSTFCLIRYKRI